MFFNGSSYISLSSGNVGNTPTNGAPWALLRQQGAAGASGGAGQVYQGRSVSPEFTTACAELKGSEPNVAMRLGNDALHSFWKDWPEDYWTIAEVLTGY